MAIDTEIQQMAIDTEIQQIIDAGEPGVGALLEVYDKIEGHYIAVAQSTQMTIVASTNTAA
jgi:hypothetical protein